MTNNEPTGQAQGRWHKAASTDAYGRTFYCCCRDDEHRLADYLTMERLNDLEARLSQALTANQQREETRYSQHETYGPYRQDTGEYVTADCLNDLETRLSQALAREETHSANLAVLAGEIADLRQAERTLKTQLSQALEENERLRGDNEHLRAVAYERLIARNAALEAARVAEAKAALADAKAAPAYIAWREVSYNVVEVYAACPHCHREEVLGADYPLNPAAVIAAFEHADYCWLARYDALAPAADAAEETN